MAQEIAEVDRSELANIQRAKALAEVLLQGDLSRLTQSQKADYCLKLCEATGLNPMLNPFGFIKTKNGEKVYALKSATEQLRHRDGISLEIVSTSFEEGLCIVRARAKTPTGRTDEDEGATFVGGLRGEDLVNARLKAITKAKRRVTLSICGLGMIDESETETIPGAEVLQVTPIVHQPRQEALPAPQGGQHASPQVRDDACSRNQLEAIHDLLDKLKHKLSSSKTIGRINEITSARLTNGDQLPTLSDNQADVLIEKLEEALREKLAKEAAQAQKGAAV
jgi:hypothetical protein